MSSVPVKPMIEFSGVRSSWLMLARNMSFALLAFSSATFFSTSSASNRVRSVMSRVVRTIAATVGSSSRSVRLVSQVRYSPVDVAQPALDAGVGRGARRRARRGTQPSSSGCTQPATGCPTKPAAQYPNSDAIAELW